MGFKNTYSGGYTHKDRGKVLDLHFQKDGTDLFQGWKAEEMEANMAAITRCSAASASPSRHA
jgi:hypothetical protein